MASTYRPLGAYLIQQPGPTRALSFREVEAHLGRALPPTARALRAWWGNHPAHPHAYHGWLAAGWRIAAVDLARQTVTFRKGSLPPAPADRAVRPPAGQERQGTGAASVRGGGASDGLGRSDPRGQGAG